MVSNKKNIFKLWVAFFMIVFMVGCGPIYKTYHSYSPPKSSQGKMCISSCVSARTSCEQLEELKKENCKSSAEFAYQLCKSKRGDAGGCYRKNCESFVANTRCDDRFNECYQTCGGSVISQQVCTAFCR